MRWKKQAVGLLLVLSALAPSTGAAQDSILYLRHNQDGSPDVTVTVNGQSQTCRTPCEARVPMGRDVTVSAGRAEHELTVRDPELVLRVDLGWRDSEYRFWRSAGVIAIVGAAIAAALSTITSLVDSDCENRGNTCIGQWAWPTSIAATGLSLGTGIFYLAGLGSHAGGEVRVLGAAGRRRGMALQLTGRF